MQFAHFGYMKLNINLFQIISITLTCLSYEVELKRDYLSYFLLIYVKSHITHAWKISMFSNSICLSFNKMCRSNTWILIHAEKGFSIICAGIKIWQLLRRYRKQEVSVVFSLSFNDCHNLNYWLLQLFSPSSK